MRLAVASVDRAVAGNLLFGLIVGLLVTVSAHAPAPQLYCPPLPSITTQSAMLKVKKADNACTIADGGYVKTNTSYRLHIAVEITGDCGTSKSECSGLPVVCSCVPSITYIRTLQQSYLRVNGTLRGSVAANPSNDPTIQNYDTETSTNTTSAGASWLTLSEGQFLYTSLTNALATPCNLEPTQFPHDQPVTMHAMACKPEWFTGGSPTVNFHGPPTGTVTIVVPSAAFEDARGPAQQAAADWAAALGRTVTVLPGYNTCAPTDPLCISFKNDQGTQPGDPVGCASFGTASYDPATGVWQGSTSVRFEPKWMGGHADNLRRTIAHEIGHYFGLFNRLDASCTYSNTLMGSTSRYAVQAPASGTALGPTASDEAALLNSTYGNQVRSTCGW